MHQLHGLIAGLGNFGWEFDRTRHNFGFMAVDWIVALAEHQKHFHIRHIEAHTHAELFEFSPEGENHGYYLLAKPRTGMNQSGEAVARICHDYQIAPRRVTILHDEMALAFGQIRLARNKSANHHNGVISIEQSLQTEDFLRIRLGIGHPPEKETIRQWVMDPYSETQMETVEAIVEQVRHGLTLMHLKGEVQAEHFLHNIGK